MPDVSVSTRRNCGKMILTLLLCAFSSWARGDENVAFKFLSESMGHYLASAGALAPDSPGDIIKVAVIVDGNGAAFPIYIQDNPNAVVELRNQLRRFDENSFQATLVGTGDFTLLFYVPLSAVEEHRGIELVDFMQPFSRCRRRFSTDYVHHAAGGRALEAGAVSSETVLPERITVPEYSESGDLPSTPPSRAHFIVAYGDRKGVLRAIYLTGADLVPFLQTLLRHGDSPEIHALLAQASYLATRAGRRNEMAATAWLWPALALLAVAAVACLVLWVRRRKRSTKMGMAPRDAAGDANEPRS